MRAIIGGTLAAILIVGAGFLFTGTSENSGVEPSGAGEAHTRQSLELTFAGIQPPGSDALERDATSPAIVMHSLSGRTSIGGAAESSGPRSGPAVVGLRDRPVVSERKESLVVAAPGDSLLEILEGHGIPEEVAFTLLTSSHAATRLRRLHAGDRLRVVTKGPSLEAVIFERAPFGTVTFRRHGEGYDVTTDGSSIGALKTLHNAVTRAPRRTEPARVRPAQTKAQGVASNSARPKKQSGSETSAQTRAPTRAQGNSQPSSKASRTPSSVQSTADASERPSGKRTVIEVARGDSLFRIFKQRGYSLNTLQAIVDSDKRNRRLRALRPGQRLEVYRGSDTRINAVVYHASPSRIVKFSRSGEQFRASERTRQLERRVVTASGTIKSSLYGAAAKAGLPDGIAADLVEIFGWDIDFALDIRAGDHFNVIYENLYVDGKFHKAGNVLAASFQTNGRLVQAVRFEVNGRADYFTPKGERLRRAFIRTPVQFARISSRFSTRRKHPILHKFRAHKGVDYAAPRGTPVRATGDGRVSFVGSKRGYGKTVVLQHGGAYTTLYAHLHRAASKLRKGSRVRQGQTIGYVGSTGLATGPHLHYEFRVRGVHRDPLTVPLPRAASLSKSQRAVFRTASQPLLRRLASLGGTTIALN